MPERDVQGAAGQLDYLFRKPSCLVLLHETNVKQVFFRAGNLSDPNLDLNPKYLAYLVMVGIHKDSAGGMSEDHDRCFSILVLGAFLTGVATTAIPFYGINRASCKFTV